MVSAGSYLLGAAALAVLALSLVFSAARLRRRLLPAWRGAPARLVEAIVAIALLIWLSEILGTLDLLYAWTLIAASLLLAALVAVLGRTHTSPAGSGTGSGPGGPGALSLGVTVGVVAVVFAHWGLTIEAALDRGIFNFDSLWYHMPFAADIVQNHSTTGLHYTDTVFTNWFYPQNSELLHAVGILLTHRDTLSLFINLGWLAIAFLAAWCIGCPYGRGHLSVVAAAIILECHTLVVREPGAAKDDLMSAALLLAAIAILLNTWAARHTDLPGGEAGPQRARGRPPLPLGGARVRPPLPVGWPLAVAGLAVGLAAGTKYTALAIAAALSLAVVVLAPAGARRSAASWWFVPALAGGGYWYLRNLLVAANPVPEITHLGPISLPHPVRAQMARPDFSVAHYATNTGVWRHYFAPALHGQFGLLWPLAVGGAIAGGALAVVWGRDRAVRWMGGVALLGMLAYLFTPLGAAGAEGAPVAFAINVRFAIPALLVGAALLPVAPGLEGWRQWALLAALLAVLLITDRSDAVLRDPARLFGALVAVLAVLAPAALLLVRRRWEGSAAVLAGFSVLAIAVVAIAYPVERDYLRDRFGPSSKLPGMGLDSAYRWARGTSGLRIGLAGTTAGFLQYGFYGTSLGNRVSYLGEKGPYGAFNAIPTCRGFRAAVNAAAPDYLVTAPFLNFIDTARPIPSPEARWLRGEPAVRPVLRNGAVTVWRVRGRLDPGGCGPLNAPLRRIPNAPGT